MIIIQFVLTPLFFKKKRTNNINFHVLAFQPGMLFFDLIKVKKYKIL